MIYLQITLRYDYRHNAVASRPALVDLAAVTTAAAVITSLQSLTITAPELEVQLSDDMLLPLTAAAGGPGSSLKMLKLSWDLAVVGSSLVRWYHALRHLDGLRNLSISHQGDMANELLDVPVEFLPNSLKVLECSRLNIVPAAVLTADESCSSFVAQQDAAGKYPRLQRLRLQRCRLSSPSIFASSQLQQLTAIDSSWPGGWAAAAAAWPNLNELVWQYDQLTVSRSSNSSCHPELSFEAWVNDAEACTKASVCRVLQDISVGCKLLRSITFQNFPWMSVEVLQPLVQQHDLIRHLKISYTYWGYERLLSKAVGGGELSSNNSNGACCIRDSGLEVVQQWLQQQMPWASVIVSFDDKMWD